jgi:8-hydroxy-5-deazaflavin:NADPH oxidoreductase
MNIAIIGSGNVGAALAAGWTKAGHHVFFGVRDPNSSKAKKALDPASNPEFKSIRSAIADAEIIVITTPPDAVLSFMDELRTVSEKTIIDTTNSIRVKPEPYPTSYHAIKSLTGNDNVVKCFNSTGFENMRDPVYQGEGVDMFMAGDSKSAKEIAAKLALDLGFAKCYDFGGDAQVELLEKLAFSWINLAIMQGHGREMAFKLVRR